MHTFIINTILLTLCHFNLFQPSKGLRQIYFDSKVNKISYQIKIQFSEYYSSGGDGGGGDQIGRYFVLMVFLLIHSFTQSSVHSLCLSFFLSI